MAGIVIDVMGGVWRRTASDAGESNREAAESGLIFPRSCAIRKCRMVKRRGGGEGRKGSIGE